VNNNGSELKNLMIKIRPYLKSYLESRGVTPNRNGFYRCINPNHEDKNPSSKPVPPNDEVLHCFSCLMSFDIFEAAAILEGRPRDGEGFIKENVQYLAKLFNIPFDEFEASPETILKLKYRNLFVQAKSILSTYGNDTHIKDIYGWDLKKVSKWGIGTVDSWKDFSSRLCQATGYNKGFIEASGIREVQFNENVITFTINDHRGLPVGFGARDSRWVDGKRRYAKWTNSPNGVLYNKSNVLYGIDAAKHYQQIYMFEGYGDVIEARLQGMLNSVALCGTRLAKGQVALIKKLNKREVVLALDNDANKSGEKAVSYIIDNYFSGQESIKLGIVDVPLLDGLESTDPREYISSKGIKEFKDLPIKDAFQWRLDKIEGNTSPEDVCDIMLPLVLVEPRHPVREKHLKTLHKHTGIRIEVIQREYERIRKLHDIDRRNRITGLVDSMQIAVASADTPDIDQIVDDSFTKIKAIQQESVSVDVLTHVETIDFIDSFISDAKNARKGLLGWKTGFSFWDQFIGGMPKKNCIVSLAGSENVGKCLHPESLVHTSRGRVPAKKVQAGDVVMGYDGKVMRPGTVKHTWTNPSQRILKIKTSSGRTLQVSDNHPLLYSAPNGEPAWQEAQNLVPGDYVATNHSALHKLESSPWYYALGALLGDGCLTKGTPEFTNKDPEVIEAMFNGVLYKYPDLKLNRKGNLTYSITDPKANRLVPNRLTISLKNLGIYGHRAETKFIPPSFEAYAPSVLAGLWDTDGSVYKQTDGAICCEYISASEKLSRGVLHLLGLIGIHASIAFKENNCLGAWRVYFKSTSDLITFRRFVNLRHRAKSMLLHTVEKKAPSGAWRASLLPPQTRSLIKQAYNSSNMTWVDVGTYLHRKHPKAASGICNKSERNYQITRGLTKACGEVFQSSKLKEAANLEVIWDKITSIDYVCTIDTIDIEVNDIHSFVVDGFVTHNSAVMANLSWNIANLNPDVMVLVHTIDDSRAQFLPRFLSIDTEQEMNAISHPNGYNLDKDTKSAINKSWIKLKDLINTKRLDIKDTTHGSNIQFIERWISRVKQDNPGRPILFFLDNFHKLLGNERDDLASIKRHITHLDRITKQYDTTIMCTMELRKHDQANPRSQDLYGSSQLGYDNNITIMMTQDMHVNPDSELFWTRPEDPHTPLPQNKLWFEKNKVSGWKGSVYLNFWPDRSKFMEIGNAGPKTSSLYQG
jgi:replicative DNA helicase